MEEHIEGAYKAKQVDVSSEKKKFEGKKDKEKGRR